MVFAFRLSERHALALPRTRRGSLSAILSAPHPFSPFAPSLNGGFART